MNKRLGLTLAGTAMATLLAACGGGPASTEGSTTEVTLGEPAKITTLDPVLAYQDTDIHAVGLIAGTLYRYTDTGEIEPALVESGEASSDGLTWTFTLRDDLKFSDDSPLTAEDVAATLERVRTNPENIFGALVASWKSAEAVDDKTVEISLSKPFPRLDAVLSYPFTMIVPGDQAESKDFYDNPVSAGLFALESWGGGSKAVFVRNENFAGDKPVVEKVNYVAVTDNNTRISQVRSGQIDFAPFIPPTLSTQVSSPAKVVIGELYGFYSLVPNNQLAPFDDVDVRRAMSLAIDRDQINEVAWNGKSRPLAGFWPPKMDGYDESVSTERDVAAAKEALKGTACEDGCSSTLYFTSGYAGEPEMATVIAQNLKEIGIDLKLQDLDATSLYSKVATGELPMYVAVQQDYVNQPAGLLNYALQQGGSEVNFSFYKSDEMEQLITEAVTTEGAEAEAALSAIDDLFVEDVPYINVSPWTTFAAENLPEEGLVSQAVAGTYDFKRQ